VRLHPAVRSPRARIPRRGIPRAIRAGREPAGRARHRTGSRPACSRGASSPADPQHLPSGRRDGPLPVHGGVGRGGPGGRRELRAAVRAGRRSRVGLAPRRRLTRLVIVTGASVAATVASHGRRPCQGTSARAGHGSPESLASRVSQATDRIPKTLSRKILRPLTRRIFRVLGMRVPAAASASQTPGRRPEAAQTTGDTPETAKLKTAEAQRRPW